MARSIGFHVASGFGHRSRQPFVSIQLGEEVAQVSPAKARELGQWLLGAADAADSDGFLIDWLKGHGVTDDPETVASILLDFRRYRGEQRPSVELEGH